MGSCFDLAALMGAAAVSGSGSDPGVEQQFQESTKEHLTGAVAVKRAAFEETIRGSLTCLL